MSPPNSYPAPKSISHGRKSPASQRRSPATALPMRSMSKRKASRRVWRHWTIKAMSPPNSYPRSLSPPRTARLPRPSWPMTSSKIAGGAVTSSEIASGAVTSSEIAYGAVTSSKIAYGAVVDNIGYKPLSPENDQAIDGTLNVRYWLHIRNLNDSALRSAHHNDGTIGFVGPRGWMVRFGDDGNFWTPIFGWLSNTLNGKANAGAECQYNSQIWSF